MMDDILKEELLALAQKARENAHVPYSHYKVGACIQCSDGSRFTGCNIENAAYGSTICAERTAIVKAVSEGHKDFEYIAIVGSGESIAFPCGSCRQVMSEFAPKATVISANSDLSMVNVSSVDKLLPHGFTSDDLE